MNDRRPVVFFHVMKCGGTSVRAGLSTGAINRPPLPVLPPEPGEEDAVPEPPSPPTLESPIFELSGEAAKAAAGGTNHDNWIFRDALLPYVLEAMQPALVLGHFRYRDRYASLAETNHFVTVLREPVDRIVSLWKYRRYKEGVDVPVSMSFDDFLESRRWSREGHAYVETFCGRSDLDLRCDEAVAATVENLRRFSVVGFTDRLDSFSSLVSEALDSTVTIPMYNLSPAPEDAEISAESMERARVVCEPDSRVYEQVLEFAQLPESTDS